MTRRAKLVRWVVGLFAVIGVLAVVAVVLVAVSESREKAAREEELDTVRLKGKHAPDFNLKRLDTGETISLQSLLGRPVVLSFWAPWALPSKAHDAMTWGRLEFGDKVAFVGVAVQTTERDANAWLRKHGSGYMQLIDERDLTMVDYESETLPISYFIDADGIVRAGRQGVLERHVLKRRVEELLESAARRVAAGGR